MKGADIVNQLRSLLPVYTSDFTDELSISSLTRSGSTVTAVTNKVHNLSDNDNVTIAGAKESITITSLTRSGNTVTATCATNHKLPPPEKLQTPLFIEIANASPSDYNGKFKLTATPSYKIFQFKITTTPASPAGNSGNLLLADFSFYNGIKQVTIIDNVTFTYELLNANLQSPAAGTIKLHKNIRIDWAADFEIVFQDYTPNEARVAQNWIYVVVNPRETFKKDTTTTDITSVQIANSEFRYETTQTFSIYTFVPSADSRLGGIASDKAREYLKPLLKTIGNYLLPSNLSECKFNPVTFQGDEPETFTGATYVHRFDFVVRGEIRNEDVIDPFQVVPLEKSDTDINKDLKVVIDFGD